MECNTREFVVDAGSLYRYFETIKDTRKKRASDRFLMRRSVSTIDNNVILFEMRFDGHNGFINRFPRRSHDQNTTRLIQSMDKSIQRNVITPYISVSLA
jgi:hypothetical protein